MTISQTLAAGAMVVVCILARPTSGADEPDPVRELPPGKATADLPALLEAHNRERAKEKLPPLKAKPKLQAAALAHARDMAEHGKMAHEGTDGSNPAQRVERQGYHFRRTGENVAAGQRSVAEVMKAWMDDPPHKKNILGDFSEMGGAVAISGDGTPYWCVDFGLPMPEFDPAKAAAGLVEAINRERSKAGKPPLTARQKLNDAARRHAQAMAEAAALEPKDNSSGNLIDRIKESGYTYRTIAGLAASGSPTPAETLKTWLDQPSQRRLLLGGEFTELGAGYAATSKGVPYWSFILARPLR